MKRPWQVWFAFACCSLLVAAAMGWLTVHALRVDRERSAARAEAELEQRVSLALWRMDTKLAPLIAEEVARPHQYYDSFIALDQAGVKAEGGTPPLPSPLLTGPNTNVILNFDASAAGQWKSPQAPPPEQVELALANGGSPTVIADNRKRLSDLARKVNVQKLIAQLPAEPLPPWQNLNQAYPSAANGPARETRQLQQSEENPFVSNYLPSAPDDGAESAANGQQPAIESKPVGKSGKASVDEQVAKAYGDLGDRSVRFQQAAQQEFTKQRSDYPFWSTTPRGTATPVVENVSRPLWIGDQLLLARRVERSGETFVQGSWLDWPRLKRELLAETADLLPKADLTPVRSEADAEPTRVLAGLPVQLVVAETAAALARQSAFDAPLQWSLGIGWLALLLALAAVAALLWGVLSLSERRAAFVSSVTHELRTPLTTFRMYAEMLARDMVPSAERRREYLETLKTEAERLTHLVENVLSYARLERGRRPKRTERTTPAAVIERIGPRLSERAAHSQMELQCAVGREARDGVVLLTDTGVVEQILFNLVDNAAKYAARATDRRIQLDVDRDGQFATFTVRDHGPGFASPEDAARSAPFSKSAQQAAETAPGVGLGLALCRRLARELGGRLDIVANNGAPNGAVVALRLPIDK